MTDERIRVLVAQLDGPALGIIRALDQAECLLTIVYEASVMDVSKLLRGGLPFDVVVSAVRNADIERHRELAEAAGQRVVYFCRSSADSPEEWRAANDLDALGVLAEPFGPNEVLRTIEAVHAGKRVAEDRLRDLLEAHALATPVEAGSEGSAHALGALRPMLGQIELLARATAQDPNAPAFQPLRDIALPLIELAMQEADAVQSESLSLAEVYERQGRLSVCGRVLGWLAERLEAEGNGTSEAAQVVREASAELTTRIIGGHGARELAASEQL